MPRRHFPGLIAAALVVASAASARAQDDFEQLRGKWRLMSYVIDGQDVTETIRQQEVVWGFDPPRLRIERAASSCRFA